MGFDARDTLNASRGSPQTVSRNQITCVTSFDVLLHGLVSLSLESNESLRLGISVCGKPA
jgi:hypothetical protein